MGPDQDPKKQVETVAKQEEKKTSLPNPLNMDPNMPDFKRKGLARQNVNFDKTTKKV